MKRKRKQLGCEMGKHHWLVAMINRNNRSYWDSAGGFAALSASKQKREPSSSNCTKIKAPLIARLTTLLGRPICCIRESNGDAHILQGAH